MAHKSKLSDKELIEELMTRFKKNAELLEEKNKLVDDLEEVNSKLLESEKLKSDFLSNIRNEINNPLTSILGLSESLVNNFEDKNSLERISKLIHNDAFRLNFQLNNIFIAAELEAGEYEPELSNFNPNELIETALSQCNYFIKKKKLTIKLNIESDKKFISDADKILVILNNLIINAIEYSHIGGEILIDSVIKNKTLIFEIRDFGIGIYKEEQSLVFDRFKQLENGTIKSHAGNGLGLSIVRDLLELLNGEIQLESIKGEGSKFIFRIEEQLLDNQNFDVEEDILFNDDNMIF